MNLTDGMLSPILCATVSVSECVLPQIAATVEASAAHVLMVIGVISVCRTNSWRIFLVCDKGNLADPSDEVDFVNRSIEHTG
jgi:hypothetical protein